MQLTDMRSNLRNCQYGVYQGSLTAARGARDVQDRFRHLGDRAGVDALMNSVIMFLLNGCSGIWPAIWCNYYYWLQSYPHTLAHDSTTPSCFKCILLMPRQACSTLKCERSPNT